MASKKRRRSGSHKKKQQKQGKGKNKNKKSKSAYLPVLILDGGSIGSGLTRCDHYQLVITILIKIISLFVAQYFFWNQECYVKWHNITI